MWNYRVIATKAKETGEITYSIKEVYYNSDGTVWMMMVEDSAPFGESRGELRRDMSAMMKAFDKETLKDWEVEFISYPHDMQRNEKEKEHGS